MKFTLSYSLFIISIIFLWNPYFSRSLEVDTSNLVVKTTSGIYEGYLNSAGVRVWKSIRYATPPTGEKRWSYPEKYVSTDTDNIISAKVDSPGCPQECSSSEGTCPTTTSEDCLYLSIASPSTASSTSNYPVMIWIHGGSFSEDYNGNYLYDGSQFSRNDVIVVTINYRLGALGFLAMPTMTGNYGFLDQRLAMMWVKENIANFGGDTADITIAGQGAGAMSVSAHLTSKNSWSLFNKAIMQSTPLGMPFQTRSTSTSNANALLKYLKCSDMECLKTKTSAEIVDAQSNAVSDNFDTTFFTNIMPFTPLVDGQSDNSEITKQPILAMIHGDMADVPILAGYNADEGKSLVYGALDTPLTTPETLDFIVMKLYQSDYSEDILSRYPFDLITGSEDVRNVVSKMFTDSLFVCPLERMSITLTTSTTTTTTSDKKSTNHLRRQSSIYLYKSNHISSFNIGGSSHSYCDTSVCYQSELPFVFNSLSTTTSSSSTSSSSTTTTSSSTSDTSSSSSSSSSIKYYLTDDEKTLSTAMNTAWSNFITSGNPATGTTVPFTFPSYSSGSKEVSVLDYPTYFVEKVSKTSSCDYWNKIPLEKIWNIPTATTTATTAATTSTTTTALLPEVSEKLSLTAITSNTRASPDAGLPPSATTHTVGYTILSTYLSTSSSILIMVPLVLIVVFTIRQKYYQYSQQYYYYSPVMKSWQRPDTLP